MASHFNFWYGKCAPNALLHPPTTLCSKTSVFYIDLKKIESLFTVYTNAKKCFEEKCDASIHAKFANRSLKSGS